MRTRHRYTGPLIRLAALSGLAVAVACAAGTGAAAALPVPDAVHVYATAASTTAQAGGPALAVTLHLVQTSGTGQVVPLTIAVRLTDPAGAPAGTRATVLWRDGATWRPPPILGTAPIPDGGRTYDLRVTVNAGAPAGSWQLTGHITRYTVLRDGIPTTEKIDERDDPLAITVLAPAPSSAPASPPPSSAAPSPTPVATPSSPPPSSAEPSDEPSSSDDPGLAEPPDQGNLPGGLDQDAGLPPLLYLGGGLLALVGLGFLGTVWWRSRRPSG